MNPEEFAAECDEGFATLRRVWLQLDPNARESVLALAILATERTSGACKPQREDEQRRGPYYHTEEYGPTKRWPNKPNWRKRGPSGILPSLGGTPAEMDAVLDALVEHPFLAGEANLCWTDLGYGHVSLGNDRRRIVITGVLSDAHYDRLEGDMRVHLERRVGVTSAA